MASFPGGPVQTSPACPAGPKDPAAIYPQPRLTRRRYRRADESIKRPRFVWRYRSLTKNDRSCFSVAAMTNPTISTRERILHQGLALMSQAGLSGVTLGVLADQAGMSKSGLFAHFRSKEDVQIELLAHMAEFVTEHVVRPS